MSVPNRRPTLPFVPKPQYWVPAKAVLFPRNLGRTVAFRDIARETNARTMIAAAELAPKCGNRAKKEKTGAEPSAVRKKWRKSLFSRLDEIFLETIPANCFAKKGDLCQAELSIVDC